jgi:hypothetical protein
VVAATGLILCEPCALRADTSLDAIALVFVSGKAAKGGDVSRVGTGFLVGSRGELLTSLHTVEEPEGGWATDEFGVKIVRISAELRDQNSGLLTDVRPAAIKAVDPASDTALIEASGKALPGVPTCPGATLATGDSILAVGVEPGRAAQPARLDPRQGAASEPQASDAPFLRVAVATKPGFSGGPVYKIETDGSRSLAGMIKGGDPLNVNSHSLIVPVGVMRQKVLAACDVPCRHPDNGIDHYSVSQEGDLHVSDWQRGGTDPTSYCDAFAAAERRRMPDRIIMVIHAANNDQRFFTGWRGSDYIVREAQYKYECKLRYEADPVYVLKVSPSCPAPPNPLDLPR